MRNLVWFRADLRVDDNPALHEALRTGSNGSLAVFFCCPEQWKAHDWGAPKVDFILRSLGSLSKALADTGVALLIETVPTFAEVPDRLATIAREQNCNRVLFNLEYEVNERLRDQEAEALLSAQDIAVSTFEDQTVLSPGATRTRQGSFYTVFSPFRRAWIERLEETGIPTPVDLPRVHSELLCAPSEIPDHSVHFGFFHGDELWPADEGSAHRLLERFVELRISDYDSSRDLAADNGTSTLSPYLAQGVLSVRRCLAAAIAANKGRIQGGVKGIDVWISELVWREFYRHVLVGYPRVSKHRAFKEDTESIAWRSDLHDLNAWRQGRTGIPFVDAGLRQLLATGWMHNRLRMVTAMFLTKDLLLDWRLGEAHFMRHLVDADLANNNGGWQWSASTGTDAAPYFRIFNPWTQGKRYDPAGDYIKRWVPELAKVEAKKLHDPQGLSSIERAALDYPEPIVDHKTARIRALEAFQQKGTGR